jgi:5'-deoxynucleotidase YfbR-like HD superfamily hydrolase
MKGARSLDRILNFMVSANRLKEVKRSGWLISRVPNPEHVGDHSYSTAMLSYLLARKKGLDADRCLVLALVHDLNEAITGDIATRYDKRKQKVQPKQKKMLERKNELRMASLLGPYGSGHIRKLLDELNENKTEEARLVKQADKLDWIIQIVAYSKYMKSDDRVEEFFLVADPQIDVPEIRYIYDKVRKKIYSERRMEKK